MEINRNQYFLVGLVLLLLGLQLRLVDSFTLTREFSEFIADRPALPVASVSTTAQTRSRIEGPVVKKEVKPQEWIGYALLSVGTVLILHSWGMKKAE